MDERCNWNLGIWLGDRVLSQKKRGPEPVGAAAGGRALVAGVRDAAAIPATNAPENPAPAAPRSRFTVAFTLLVAAIAAGALLSFCLRPEPDFWWHLAQGREVARGRLVRTNLFSGTNPNHQQPYTS